MLTAAAHCDALMPAANATRLPTLASLAHSAHPAAHASAGTAHATASPHAVAGVGALRGATMLAAPLHRAAQPRTDSRVHSASHEPSAPPTRPTMFENY